MHYMLQHVVPFPVNLKYVSQFSDETASMYTRALLTVIFAGKLLETWIMTLPIFQKVDFIHKTKPGVIFELWCLVGMKPLVPLLMTQFGRKKNARTAVFC